jgi:hypothetical protein
MLLNQLGVEYKDNATQDKVTERKNSMGKLVTIAAFFLSCSSIWQVFLAFVVRMGLQV